MVAGDCVAEYLKQIARTPLLAAAEEVSLAIRIEVGVLAAERLATRVINEPRLAGDLEWLVRDGAAAKEHLITANLRLVVSVARHYLHRGLSFPDLIQEGNLGLIRAVEKFDHRRGYKFSTGAVWSIRREIAFAIAHQGRCIRLPVGRVDQVNDLGLVQSSLRLSLGREPRAEELCRATGLTMQQFRTLREHLRPPRSLDAPILVDTGDGPELVPLGWVIEDHDQPELAEAVVRRGMRDECERLFEGLSVREADVLRMRYGLDDGIPKTLVRVSEVLHVSRERVRQIESAAVEKLRGAARMERAG